MRFAIPLAGGRLTAHFGHCQEFALIDADEEGIKGKEVLIPPPHEPGVLPRWLSEQGADIVIAGGMGQKAIALFEANDIGVVVGAPAESPEQLVQKYLNQTLTSGRNICDH
jgi:predicted Fe-Mo cluster-binding NifX family protein